MKYLNLYDWLKKRSGCAILIYSAGQGLIGRGNAVHKNDNSSALNSYKIMSPSYICLSGTYFNPCPAEPGYTLSLQTV